MPERLSKKSLDLWEEIGTILKQKEESGKPPLPRSSFADSWTFREKSLTLNYTETLFRNWLEVSRKARGLSSVEFRDDITDLKHEVDNLHLNVESLRHELAVSKKTVEDLSKEVSELRGKKPPANVVPRLCKTYIARARAIDIVQKILVAETKDITTIWTVIKAPPFEDSLRTPIYEAQLSVLSSAKEHISLDFYMLNVSELSDNQELDSIIPSHARIVWER